MTLLNIAEQLAALLENNSKIHAMWLEGSYATGKYTNQSDIDIWLDVVDSTFDECISDFRKQLDAIARVRHEKSRGVYSEMPKLAKHTFYLNGFTDDQRIELDLQEHSRRYIFSKQKENIKVLFDKDNTIKWGD